MSAIGISMPAILGIEQGKLSNLVSDPEEEVPRAEAFVHTNHEEVKNGARPIRQTRVYTIPRDEWIITESAADAASSLAAELRQQTHTSVQVSKEVDGQNETMVIEPQYTIKRYASGEFRPDISFREFSESFSNTITGSIEGHSREFDIRPKKVTQRQDCLDYYTNDYNPIPAGCEMTAEEDISSCGTLCTPAYDNDLGTHILTTAGHLVDHESGREVWQPAVTAYSADAISDKTDDVEDDDTDFATLQPTSSYTYKIANDNGGYNEEITGTVATDN